jgi:glycosyltransferase involved in cell wall biosynthesis
MDIFLDARMLYHSGVGRYSRNLYRELLKLKNPPRITLGVDEQVRRRLETKENLDTISFPAPIYSLREQFWGGYLSWRYKQRFDLFHFPSYNIPWLLPSHTVVTCHDLIHLLFPRYFSPPKVYFARHLLKRIADRAKRIITVSENTRQDILNFFPQAEGKIRVVYNGVGPEFHPLEREEVAEFKRRRQLDDYLLYVGTCKPYKNLPRLIAAYAQLKVRYPTLKLIILSQKDYNNNEVCDAISHWKVGEGVVQERPADTQELNLYYNAARLLVLPSMYEGFGLPPLEAMACGTPVVVSNISSLPEVVGDAGILIDPSDVDSIVAGVEQGLCDSGLYKRLSRDGLDRARQFTWEETARRTWEVYQEVMGQGSKTI